MIFACARLGALAVHVNTRFGTAEVAYLLSRSRAETLVTTWDFAPVDFAAVFAQIAPEQRPAVKRIIGRFAHSGTLVGLPVVPLEAVGHAPDAATPDTPCLTFTTSGTTRGPKLVLHVQRSIASHAANVAQALAMDAPRACLLAAVPLCGTFGNALAMSAVASGARIVLMEQFDGARAAHLIRHHRITHTAGGDDMLGRIAEAAASRPFDTLVFSGFARFTPTATASIAAASAMGMAPRGLYGSSEVQALFAFAPDDRSTVDGGVPVSPRAHIAVRDPETGASVPDGEDGELCIKAPSTFAGYLNDDAATHDARTPDGFFRTGDLAHVAPPGFVFRSRIGDTLRLGGFLVNPEEIEGFLQALPGVEGAQVVAADHAGQRKAVAFVRAKAAGAEATSEDAILAACRVSLARYKQPARVVFLDAFPVTDGPNGVKIQRAKLRDMAAELLRV